MEASTDAAGPARSEEVRQRLPTFTFPGLPPNSPLPSHPPRVQTGGAVLMANLGSQASQLRSYSPFPPDTTPAEQHYSEEQSQTSTEPVLSNFEDPVSNSPSGSHTAPRHRLRRSVYSIHRGNQSSHVKHPSTSLSADSTDNALCLENDNNKDIAENSYTLPPSNQAQAQAQAQAQDLGQASSASTPGGSLFPLYHLDHERIIRWRHTATTLPQGTIPSPLTPRRFTELEMDMDGVKNFSPDSLEADGDVEVAMQQGFAEETQDTGPVYAALKQMWDLQESLRSGHGAHGIADVEDVSGNNIGPRQVKFSTGSPGPSSKDKGKGKAVTSGDPKKDPKPKPPPLYIPPAPHPFSSQPPSDPQTYTTPGLLHTLRALYHPSSLPSPLLTSLPPTPLLTTLSNPATPLGSRAQHRTLTSPHPLVLDSKARNYISFFIDTLLTKLRDLSIEVGRLEEENEDKEVQKAALQTDIGFWYNEGRGWCSRVGGLEKVIVGLMGEVQENRRDDVVMLAKECSVDVMEIWGRLGGTLEGGDAAATNVATSANMAAATPVKDVAGEHGEHGETSKNKGKEAVRDEDDKVEKQQQHHTGQNVKVASLEKKVKRSEYDIQYWKARAEAAEAYVKALQGDETV